MNNIDLIRLYNKFLWLYEKEEIALNDNYTYQGQILSVDRVFREYNHAILEDDFKVDLKYYTNWKARKKYFNKWIRYIIDNYDNLYFLTLTFNDDTLKNLNADSRRQKIRRWLSKYCNIYVANIDYGSTTEREHYHALVSFIDTNILQDSNHKDKKGHIIYNIKEEFYYNGKVGFTTAIELYNKEYIMLSHYIDKLSNHAFKDTTCNQRIIYSRLKNSQKLALLRHDLEHTYIKKNKDGYITNYAIRDWHKTFKRKSELIEKFINDNNMDIEDL